MNVEMTVEQELELKNEISPVVKAATDLVIKTPEQSIEAQEVLREIKRRQKKFTEIFDPICDAAHKAWKKTTETRASFNEPLEQAERLIKSKVVSFNNEEEKKRRDIEAKAEAKRKEDERKEKERLEEQARKAREAGKVEKAEALEEKAESVAIAPTFTPPPAPIKAQGSSFKTVWKAEAVDLMLLCKSVVEGRAPIAVITVDQSALNSFAKGVRGAMPIPGLRFYEESSMSVRS